MFSRLTLRGGEHRGGQAVFVQLSREAVSHPAVKANLERQQQRALLLVQRMHLQRHESAGRLHLSKVVHGEQDELHGGDEYAVLEEAHRLHLPVLPQLQQVLFPVELPALRVQCFVRRIGIQIDVQIRLDIRFRQRPDLPLLTGAFHAHNDAFLRSLCDDGLFLAWTGYETMYNHSSIFKI